MLTKRMDYKVSNSMIKVKLKYENIKKWKKKSFTRFGA